MTINVVLFLAKNWNKTNDYKNSPNQLAIKKFGYQAFNEHNADTFVVAYIHVWKIKEKIGVSDVNFEIF